MTEEEKQAYLYGAQQGAEYMHSIGKTDLATLTPDQVLTFSECICRNYHLKYAELTNK